VESYQKAYEITAAVFLTNNGKRGTGILKMCWMTSWKTIIGVLKLSEFILLICYDFFIIISISIRSQNDITKCYWVLSEVETTTNIFGKAGGLHIHRPTHAALNIFQLKSQNSGLFWRLFFWGAQYRSYGLLAYL